MKILADENVFEPIIEYLRSKGHEVISVRSPELSGSSDDDLYRKAVAEGLSIITMDKDFLRMYRFPPHACGGIIVIKVYQRKVEETTRIFSYLPEANQAAPASRASIKLRSLFCMVKAGIPEFSIPN